MSDADRGYVDFGGPSGDEPRQGLRRSLPEGTVLLVPEEVRRAVARAFGMRIATLMSKSKAAHVSEARDAVCYLVRKHSRMGLEQVAAVVGRNDHSTALHACRRAERRRQTDTWFLEITDELERKLVAQAGDGAAA